MHDCYSTKSLILRNGISISLFSLGEKAVSIPEGHGEQSPAPGSFSNICPADWRHSRVTSEEDAEYIFFDRQSNGFIKYLTNNPFFQVQSAARSCLIQEMPASIVLRGAQ